MCLDQLNDDIVVTVCSTLGFVDYVRLVTTCTHLNNTLKRHDIAWECGFCLYSAEFWYRAMFRQQKNMPSMWAELCRIERFQLEIVKQCGERMTETTFFQLWENEPGYLQRLRQFGSIDTQRRSIEEYEAIRQKVFGCTSNTVLWTR